MTKRVINERQIFPSVLMTMLTFSRLSEVRCEIKNLLGEKTKLNEPEDNRNRQATWRLFLRGFSGSFENTARLETPSRAEGSSYWALREKLSQSDTLLAERDFVLKRFWDSREIRR